jgi:hypothetical protein
MMLFRCYKGFESSLNHSSICYHVLPDIHSMYDVTTEGRAVVHFMPLCVWR